MSPLKLQNIIELLKSFISESNSSLEIIVIGGLALHYYGKKDRVTLDLDAEVKGDIENLQVFLKRKHVPADLGENFSGWSIIAMPDGYRKRALQIYNDSQLVVKVLHPLDFIIAKLRRFTEQDIEDAIFVVRRFNLGTEEIRKAGEDSIRNSPKDTLLFVFKKNLNIFIGKLEEL